MFFYIALIATKDLIKLKSYQQVATPYELIVLFFSVAVASNHTALMSNGLKFIPLYLHLPFQVIIPVILLVGVAMLKNRKNKNQNN